MVALSFAWSYVLSSSLYPSLFLSFDSEETRWHLKESLGDILMLKNWGPLVKKWSHDNTLGRNHHMDTDPLETQVPSLEQDTVNLTTYLNISQVSIPQ